MAHNTERKPLRAASLKTLTEGELGGVVGGSKADEKPREALTFPFKAVIVSYGRQ